MTIQLSLSEALGALWGVAEIALILATRRRLKRAGQQDRGSRAILWTAIFVGICLGILSRAVAATRMGLSPHLVQGISLALLVSGLIIRSVAVITLGRFFTTSVAAYRDHQLVRTGLYRHLRHPSYAGLLLAFLGLGFSAGNWLGPLAVLGPILPALFYRIRVEEAVLLSALGEEYAEYRRSTKRLIPGVL